MPFDDTVNVPVPVAADPVLGGAMAVIVVIPPSTLPIAVARPLELIVATRTSLETQVTWLVKSCVVGEPVKLPIAMNCDVSPITATGCWLGITVIESSVRAGEVAVTVRVAVPTTPLLLAVIVVTPALKAVASPVELIVATCVSLEIHCT